MAKMREFKVTGPDGKVISVTAPENATDDEIIKLAERKFYAASDRPKVDLDATKADSLRILNAEYTKAVQRLIEARKTGDQAKIDREEADRVSVAREIQRLGGEIPGAPPTSMRTAAPSPEGSEAQSAATMARQALSGVDADRAMLNLAAMAGGAGGSAFLDRLGGPMQGPAGGPAGGVGPQSAVQKWSGAMGYGDRGGRTFAEAHQLEQGLRKGAKIGGVQPEFRFAKPPIPEPSVGQRTVQSMMSSPKAMGALGGLSMAESGMDAMKRMQSGDPIGAAIAGAGALGGAGQMIPTLPTRVGGAALSAASPLTLYLYDKMRTTSPQAAQQMLTNVDLMGNPMP